MDDNDPSPLHRLSAKADDTPSAAYKVADRNYAQQYANIYFNRLFQLRSAVLNNAKKKWGQLEVSKKAKYVSKVLDIKPATLCYVVGTIYVEMALKPNILDEVAQEYGVVTPPPREKYVSDVDQVMLEDEYGRVKLTGAKLKQEQIVTGVVVGVLGSENALGEFEVIDVVYPGPPKPSLSTRDRQSKGAEDKYVALISGLNFGQTTTNSMAVQMMTDFLTGELGSDEDQHLASNISRVIICGNSMADSSSAKEDDKKSVSLTRSIPDPIQLFDSTLEQLVASLPVDVMPGDKDPANATLPQQPIHFSIFSKSSQYSTFKSVTNPYQVTIDDSLFLGTSGQTISDVFKYVENQDRLQLAEKTLIWRHLAPTAPDTLWCYPFRDQDPFVVQSRPNVYFLGNQPEYKTSLLQDPMDPESPPIRVILVPDFSATATIVLVNLRDFSCKPLTFTAFDENELAGLVNDSADVDMRE
ncbi:DNA polymerase alpha/epsilon subunit B-domain-containing protein [Paraphysoderma sedebokerense]|nr:DNA polymerase alpha/epsilon subunit B-domain-containing protein [Paraphysoderma sedebokerense]